MGTGRQCANRDHGAAAVEFALLLPVLILLLGGIIDFGFAFNAQISLTHAAREGVRVEAIGIDGVDPVATALNAFSAPGVSGASAEVNQSCNGGGGQAQVRITTTYSFFLLPFGDQALEGQAVMRCGG